MKIIKGWYVAALAAALAALAASPAVAVPLEGGHYRVVSSEVIEGFCGDLTVREDLDLRGAFLVNTHGPDGLVYYQDKLSGTEAYTNLANDKTMTATFSIVSKDQKVTDNGDGTLTILFLSTGSFKVTGPGGEPRYLDAGQVWYEILVDHAGTPTDPADDEFLEFTVKGFNGREDLAGHSLCGDVHELIG